MSTNTKGFKIDFDPVNQILHVKAWGSWDTAFMKKYNSSFMEKIEELCATGKAWYVLMDLTDFSPQSEDVRTVLGQQFSKAKALGMKKLAYWDSELALSTLRLPLGVRQCSPDESEDEAFEWLLE